MNKKQNKGITLVALVITIIVLIILAAVSINAVMNDGLIKNAETAVGKYEAAKENEIAELSNLEAQLLEAKGESPEHVAITWTQAANGKISNDVNDTTYTVGDEVTLTATGVPTTNWLVYGVKNNKLELISLTSANVTITLSDCISNIVSSDNPTINPNFTEIINNKLKTSFNFSSTSSELRAPDGDTYEQIYETETYPFPHLDVNSYWTNVDAYSMESFGSDYWISWGLDTNEPYVVRLMTCDRTIVWNPLFTFSDLSDEKSATVPFYPIITLGDADSLKVTKVTTP